MALRDQLDRAERDVAAEDQHIARQEQMIERLRKQGHADDQAERSLGMMRRAREAFVHHRRILLERLGLYRS
jgi:hypothetical protein